MRIDVVLKAKYPPDVVDALLHAYKEIEHNYFLRKWKASELDAGHFVEAARRMIEFALSGTHTPIGKDLPKFNDAALKTYEGKAGDDAIRILIPRVLWSVFGIRNKRGVGHVGTVSPNQMDSGLILAAVKWVLAEFVRQASGASVDETQKAVDSIIVRRLELLWKEGAITRVTKLGVPAREQVMLLLYDTSPQKASDVQGAIEYKNTSDFRKLLKSLHKKRFIEYSTETDTCIITTPGIVEAERLALHHQVVT